MVMTVIGISECLSMMLGDIDSKLTQNRENGMI